MPRESRLGEIVERKFAEVARKGEDPNPFAIGQVIRDLRERAGLSGVELCRRGGGFDPRTLNAIEKGRIRNPSLESLERIARGLGCLVSDLFKRAEMDLTANYHRGTPKGVFQMDFPKQGLKIVSATPPIEQFFCGKLILAPQRKMTSELLSASNFFFIEVVMGRIAVEIENETAPLKEGENLFFRGNLRPSFRNLLNRESTLWLVTAPSFFHASTRTSST